MIPYDEHKWDGDRFYSVVVSNQSSHNPCWSAPFADAHAAWTNVKTEVAEGRATMGFVVHITASAKKIVRIVPENVRKIIRHYQDLVDSL